MPRKPADPVSVSNAAARRIWLRAQRLDVRAPFGEGAAGVAEAVAHLGYVQIDTINVIERSHHHILFSRANPATLPRDAPHHSLPSP